MHMREVELAIGCCEEGFDSGIKVGALGDASDFASFAKAQALAGGCLLSCAGRSKLSSASMAANRLAIKLNRDVKAPAARGACSGKSNRVFHRRFSSERSGIETPGARLL
jgi:hypothetical protein